MQSVPEWAKEAVSIAESNGLMPSPIGGSFDFYRLLAYLYKRVF
jgi:lysozyme